MYIKNILEIKISKPQYNIQGRPSELSVQSV